MKLKKTTLELLVRSIKNSNLPEIAKNLTNDFSSLAKRVCLEIEVIQKRLLDSGALGVSISGKGPAVFGILILGFIQKNWKILEKSLIKFL